MFYGKYNNESYLHMKLGAVFPNMCSSYSMQAGLILYCSWGFQGIGEYQEGNDFSGNSLRLTRIIGGKSGASWLLMHEQDEQNDNTGVGE